MDFLLFSGQVSSFKTLFPHDDSLNSSRTSKHNLSCINYKYTSVLFHIKYILSERTWTKFFLCLVSYHFDLIWYSSHSRYSTHVAALTGKFINSYCLESTVGPGTTGSEGAYTLCRVKIHPKSSLSVSANSTNCSLCSIYYWKKKKNPQWNGPT